MTWHNMKRFFGKTNLQIVLFVLMFVLSASTAFAQWTDPLTGVIFTPTSGTGSRDFNHTEGASKACDGKADTKMGSNSSSLPAYVIVQASSAVKISGYSITTGSDNVSYNNRNPKNWSVSGSNDGSDWTPIATITNDAVLQDINNKTYFYSCTSSEAYTYFKFEVSATRGDTYMQFSEFHPLVFLPSSSTAAGYVIFASNKYLPNSTTAVNSFSPSTCLWTLTNSKLKNGDNYLRTNKDKNAILVENTNSRNGIVLGGNESGTTGQTIYINDGLYLRYNSGWKGTTNSGNATACLFAVTKHTYNVSAIDPAFSGADQFSDSEIGNTKNYTITTDAYYRLGFFNYVFYNNTDHFFKSDNSTSLPTPPSAEGITYTWELSDNAAGHVSVSTSGAVTYDNAFEEDTYVTLTLKATSNTSNHVFTSATKTILFEAPKVDPTSVSATDMTVYVGKSQNASVTLTPNPCYRHLDFTSANTGIATVNSTTGEVTGVSVGNTTVTVKAYKIGNTEYLSTSFNVVVKDKVATPVIAFEPNESDNGATATATITCTTDGASIYYTTDGTTPTTSSTPCSATFQVSNGNTVKAIAAKDMTGWDHSDVASLTYVKRVLPTPVIVMNNGSVTFTCAEPGVTFRYTTGATPSDPTSSTATTWTEGSSAITTGITNEQIIKVIATKSGWTKSAVASRQYIMASGVSGNVVTLNDYEDHNWTYYAGSTIGNYNTKYEGYMYSPAPRNVKITYYGNGKLANLTTGVSGVKVGVDASANTFVYYKTIENKDGYRYTTIPNPFSVRPKISGTYYGFTSWRVKSVSGGTITGKAVGSTINAETEIVFVPTRDYTPNCTSMEVELEAVWDVAECRTDGNFSHNYGVERTFYIVSSTSPLQDIPASNTPCTYSSFYPNGTTDGTTAATLNYRHTRNGGFTAKADSKIEYIYLNNNNSTINAAGHNLTIGRGVSSNSSSSSVCAANIYGFHFDSTSNQTYGAQNFVLRIESGNYTNCHLFSNTVKSGDKTRRPTFSGTNTIRGILGCDYDRARGDTNSLEISSSLWMAEGCWFHDSDNLTNGFFKCWTKSGKLLTSEIDKGGGGSESVYIGTSGTQTTQAEDNNRKSAYIPPRFLYIEGGILGGVAGGMDDVYYTGTTQLRVYIRMTGGIVRGCMYGAGSYAKAAGNRNFVLLGGEIGGWVAAGCNGIGTSTSESADGTTNGDTYLYIGGNIKIGYKNQKVNDEDGGNVFGAGKGTKYDSNGDSITYPMGTVNNSNLVIADDAQIEKDVYGGGNFGYTKEDANLYILGGTVEGKVFGGSKKKQGKKTTIYMEGGLVKGGIYGGSNETGEISDDVTIQINGGQVGTSTAPGNVHGGGYGQPTRVTGNVDITIGTRNTSNGETAGSAVIYGDVYGGSALGYVNGKAVSTTKHTNVTLNAGAINGNLYGGALGQKTGVNGATSNIEANVYGLVQVTVNGGEAKNVFGCNNINGRPRSTVNVLMTGGEVHECVYGGGNAAPYTGTPKVKITGGTVEQSVFGGGLGSTAAITGDTRVIITGTSHIKQNVYGGGNGGLVTGNTHVDIGGE